MRLYVLVSAEFISVDCFGLVQPVSCVLKQNPRSLKVYKCLSDTKLQQIHTDESLLAWSNILMSM